MKAVDIVRVSVVLVVGLVVQHTLLDVVTVGGAHPDLMLLLAAAGGYSAGPDRGAGFGFATGLLADLFLPTTFGLSALVFCMVGYVTAVVTAGLVRSSWWLPPVTFAAATAAGLSGYAILGAVLGQPGMIAADLVPALTVAVPAAAVLALPALRMVAWALPAPASGLAPGSGSTLGAGR